MGETVTTLEFDDPSFAGMRVVRPVINVEVSDSPGSKNRTPNPPPSEPTEDDFSSLEGQPSHKQREFGSERP